MPLPVTLPDRPVYWLLVAMPLAVVLGYVVHAPAHWVFLSACVAVIPLAALMGRATESLADTFGAGIGGLLNATFGNAAELIIALAALSKGPHMYPLVKASITGSIIGNVLLVLGGSMLAGGLKYRRQTFNRTAASLGTTLLALAAIGLIVPTLYYHAHAAHGIDLAEARQVKHISMEIAVLLAVVYGFHLWFSLRTHSDLFDDSDATAKGAIAPHAPEWTRRKALIVLLAATAFVALMSELLVGSVEHAAEAMGMGRVFVGVIIVAIIGNAAEHSTAILMAMKDKMDLAVNIAVGSSIQVALFVAPLLVFASLLFGHGALDLHFTPMETVAVVISVVILSMVSQDGETHWLEGVMLLAVYVMLGIAFYYLGDAKVELVSPAAVQ